MLDASLTRILTLQFLAGRFDPLENQTYTNLTFDEVDTADSQALTAEGAQQGMVSVIVIREGGMRCRVRSATSLIDQVLLRNDKSLLPLSPGIKIACIGPHCITTEDLMGMRGAAGEPPQCAPLTSSLSPQEIISSSAVQMGRSTVSQRWLQGSPRVTLAGR